MRVRLDRSTADQRGAIAVIAGLVVLVIVMTAAFTTDFGLAYAHGQALQSGADSAATAVARDAQLRIASNPTLTCGQVRDIEASKAPARSLALINSQALYGSSLAVDQVQTQLSCVSPSTGQPSGDSGILQVTVTATLPVDAILGGVMGYREYEVTRTATAVVGMPSSLKVFPMAICSTVVDEILKDAQTSLTSDPAVFPHALIYLDGSPTCPGVVPPDTGNWGWLRCDFSDSTTLPGSTTLAPSLTVLRNMLSGDCASGADIVKLSAGGATVSATPGFKLSGAANVIQDAVIGSDFLLPVFSALEGTGSNARYTISKFVPVRICGIMGNSSAITSSSSGGTPCYVTWDAVNGDVSLKKGVTPEFTWQVQLTTPPNVGGELSDTCTIGDTSCQAGVTIVQLIK